MQQFHDLEVNVSSRRSASGATEAEIVIHFRGDTGDRSEVRIKTTTEYEPALSLETTRENAWRSVRDLIRMTAALTQTPAAALLVNRANREKVARGELTEDNIF